MTGVERTMMTTWKYCTIPGTKVRLRGKVYQLLWAEPDGRIRRVRDLASGKEHEARIDLYAKVEVILDDVSVEMTGETGHDPGQLAQAVVVARLGGQVLLTQTDTGDLIAPAEMLPTVLIAHCRLMHDGAPPVGALNVAEFRTLEKWHAAQHAEGKASRPHRHEEL